MQEATDNRSFLCKEWDSILSSKEAKMIMIGNIEGYKHRKEGSHHIVLNPSLKLKDSRDPSKTANQGKKTVFIPFSSKSYNFSNLPNNQMICHINLDEEQLISKQESYKITQKFFDKSEDQDDKIQSHSHPLFINTSPICRSHSMLLMYLDEELPQIVGSDIMLLLLNIFKIFPGIKVGYNSLGASASVNHLHFHLMYSQELIGEPKMPIEMIKTHPWLKTSLVNPSEQINLYTVGVQIDEIKDLGTKAFVLTPYVKSEEELEFAEATNSLSFVFGIIINELIEVSIPHNVLITNNGLTIYIFLRDFHDEKSHFKYAWVEYSGVIPVSDQSTFEQMKEEQIINIKKNQSVEPEIVEHIKKNVQEHLKKFI